MPQSNGSPFTTGFVENTSFGRADLGTLFIEKDYLIDAYPNINPAIKSTSVWYFGGRNNFGVLGTNDAIQRSIPSQFVFGGTNWNSIASSRNMTTAIKTDGTLWIWGYNGYGSLGNNDRVTRSSPVQTVATGTNWKSSAVGNRFAGGIKCDGTLWMWGKNTLNELGDNTAISKSSPVQTISTGTNWNCLSIGYSGQSGAIKCDGTLWMWGFGRAGTFANNNSSNVTSASPIQTVSTGTNWKNISVRCAYGMAAVKTDGTLWLWGYGNYGILGTNSTIGRSSPVQTIAGGTNWKCVLANDKTTWGLKTDGTLWTWGYNNLGQLADGSQTNKSSPVQTIATGTNWKLVGNSNEATTGINSALKTDGTLWVWGNSNYLPQWGNPYSTRLSSPVQILALGTNWKTVTNSGWSPMFLREDGDW